MEQAVSLMSIILIDTNVVMALIEISQARPLPEVMSDRLRSAETVLMSAASVFEINQKARVGKIEDKQFNDSRLDALQNKGIALLSLTPETMARAASLQWTYRGRDHRDPFDRMIAATALERRAQVMSSDAAFDMLGIERLWIPTRRNDR